MIEVPNPDIASRPRQALKTARQRLIERAPVLLAALAVTLLFWLFAALSLRAALWGAVTLTLWSAAWPMRTSTSSLASVEPRHRMSEQARSPGSTVWMSIIASMPDPAIALDTSGMVVAVNITALDLFPAAKEGRHISQVTRAPELLTCINVARDMQKAQACRLDFSVPVARRLVATVAPLAGADGGGQGPALLIVLRDLTEQDRIIRMRADFVANASHELRTPLASLKGFVETLRGAAKDDTQAREKFLKIMQQQADRMARIIDDLLSLSRVEMQAHLMPRDRVNLGNVISHVAQTLAPIAADKSMTIDVAPFPDSFAVTGDRDELIQVFQNLLENAIKYGRTGGNVSVQSTIALNASGAGRITVAIADDGPGISPEHLPRLTERFYRVNAAQSRNVGGTGLGLAIVKHVLNRHRADLQIESVVGQGSTFKVSFPVRQDA